jgi:hypothetical protein
LGAKVYNLIDKSNLLIVKIISAAPSKFRLSARKITSTGYFHPVEVIFRAKIEAKSSVI